MNTGVVGVDAISNTGAGLPDLLDHAVKLKGRFARTVNDYEMKEQLALRDAGYEVMNRFFEPEKGRQDDDAHVNIPDVEGWLELHYEHSLKPTATLPGGIFKIINEPGPPDYHALAVFLRRSRIKCREFNKGISITSHRYRRMNAPGWSYGNPEQSVYAGELDNEFKLWCAEGHDLSAHEGYDGRYDTFEKAYPQVIGRHIWMRDRYRPRAFVIDEFASSWDAWNGWEAEMPNGERWQSEEETATLWARAAYWYAANGFFMIPFTYRKWKNGFSYAHAEVIKSRLVYVNATSTVLEAPPVIVPPPAVDPLVETPAAPGLPTRVRVRTQINVRAAPGLHRKTLRSLPIGAEINLYFDTHRNVGNYAWAFYRATSGTQSGWIALSGDWDNTAVVIDACA